MISLQKNGRKVALFSKAMSLASWLHGLPRRITPPPLRLVEIGAAFWQSRALHAATSLDIATVIGDETLSAEEIARRVFAQPDPVSRLLRMLTAIGVFERCPAERFKNNEISHFLRQDDPRNVRAMILMHNSEEMSRPWYEQLERGITSGTPPFELTHGTDLYDYMDTHASFDSLFARAMDNAESFTGENFAIDFDWTPFNRVIDIGGSKGGKVITLLRRHTHLSALVVDRPQVICEADGYWRARADPALLGRLEYFAGDVFAPLPAAQTSKDLFFLSGLLHGFDDSNCAAALRNVAAAASGADARIAIHECVLDEARPALGVVLADMQMFMGTRGRERTLKEWIAVFELGGVVLEQVVNLRSFSKILVLRANE